MTEQNGSDPMAGKENETDDEDIIDLTDEIPPESSAEDEDIIELTDEITVAPDEETEIELDSALLDEDDEETIELTDKVTETQAEEAELDLDLDLDDLGKEEEAIEDAAGGDRELEFDLDLGGDEEAEDDDDVFELTDEVTETEAEEAELDLDLDLDDLGEEEEALEDAAEEDKELEFDLDLGGAEEEEDDEVLELTDEVTETEVEEAELDLDLDLDDLGEEEDTLEDAAAEDKELEFDLELGGAEEAEDDEVIELTDEVTETQAEKEDAALEKGADDLLGLLSEETEPAGTQMAEAEEAQPPEDLDLQVSPDLSAEDELPQKDVEMASAMGVPLDPTRDLSMSAVEEGIMAELTGPDKDTSEKPAAFVIPQKDLEAAIERVIESKLSGKIDALLNSSIEKAVSAEIGRLKRLLTNTLSEK